MVAVDELAKYLTVEEAARALDVPESRFRASWRQSGIVRPATLKGLMQFTRRDVVRAAVLVCLQRVFGEQSSLAIELAKAMTPEQLDQVLGATRPRLEVTMGQPHRTFKVDLDPEYLARVREGISTVRV
jgi:hypothetical protein